MIKRVVKNIVLVLILFLVFFLFFNFKSVNAEQQEETVLYYSNIQSKGWEESYTKSNGDISGTEGQSLRLETIKIKLSNMDSNINIRYQVHIQNIGWQEWKQNGDIAGTENQNLRLEAIKIELTRDKKI